MDRVLYVAMAGARQTLLAQALNSHNLANTSTVGFRADLFQSRSMPVFGDGHPSRVFAMTERPGVSFDAGTIQQTGRELDIAVSGEGWIAVQAPDGSEAYTRAGDLRLSVNGLLETGGIAIGPALPSTGCPAPVSSSCTSLVTKRRPSRSFCSSAAFPKGSSEKIRSLSRRAGSR